MLPVVESRDDIDLQQFAKKTQKRVSTALDIVNTNVTIEDISTWKESKYMYTIHRDINLITCNEYCVCVMMHYQLSLL